MKSGINTQAASGNRRPGRPPGRKNNKTLLLQAAAQQAIESLESPFEGDAHAFLAWIYKNPSIPLETRIMAAGRALRVEKPTLSATQGQIDVSINLAERLKTARVRLSVV